LKEKSCIIVSQKFEKGKEVFSALSTGITKNVWAGVLVDTIQSVIGYHPIEYGWNLRGDRMLAQRCQRPVSSMDSKNGVLNRSKIFLGKNFKQKIEWIVLRKIFFPGNICIDFFWKLMKGHTKPKNSSYHTEISINRTGAILFVLLSIKSSGKLRPYKREDWILTFFQAVWEVIARFLNIYASCRRY